MKAQLASDYARDRAGDPWGSSPPLQASFSLSGHAAPVFDDYEYCTYGISKRPNVAAAVASVLVAAAAFASFMVIGGHHHHHHHRDHRLTVMELVDLQPPPPPPAAPNKVQPKHESPPEIVAPPALVSIPAPPSPVITALQPAPTPVRSGASEVHAPVGPPAAPSQETTNVGDLSARMISATPPSYPLESRRAQEQGIVVLSVMLGADGRVASVAISRSSGSARLDHAALSAVRRWRWEPMMRNGSPVLLQGLVTIPFVLRT